MTRATLFNVVPFSVYLLLVILISLQKNSTNLLLEVQAVWDIIFSFENNSVPNYIMIFKTSSKNSGHEELKITLFDILKAENS